IDTRAPDLFVERDPLEGETRLRCERLEEASLHGSERGGARGADRDECAVAPDRNLEPGPVRARGDLLRSGDDLLAVLAGPDLATVQLEHRDEIARELAEGVLEALAGNQPGSDPVEERGLGHATLGGFPLLDRSSEQR